MSTLGQRRAPRQLGIGVVVLLAAAACLQPPPDVGPTEAIRAEDTRLVVLLRAVDRVGDTHGEEAARMIREEVLPRARANAATAATLRPRHPRAQAMARRLAALLRERVEALESYAAALDSGDPATLLAAVRRQRVLEESLARLDRRIVAASHAPATRGCGTTPGP